MLETFFEKRFVLERFRASPVGSHIDGFATSLMVQGYSWSAGASCLRHAVHLGRWMEPQGIALAALDEAVIASFVQHLPTCALTLSRIDPGLLSKTDPPAEALARSCSAQCGIAREARESRTPTAPFGLS